MKKLFQGIIDFRQRVYPTCRDKFTELAKGQHPDALFIACSDSRVAPNWFASSDPGDLFVIRNVGNLISPCGTKGLTDGDESELAAVEFAVLNLKVADVIICGHSDCGAMHALIDGASLTEAPHLKSWLRHGKDSLQKLKDHGPLNASEKPVNQLSQLNVLQQMEHMKSYPFIHEKIAKGELKLHGWWFDIAKAAIYSYQADQNKFILIE
ncbi:MAG: carbonic anhydrase [Deltaproteobacteria bacterium CG11_big_fil_rev_8_21_14_0_20_45_16]|nr:MAG: carbonic anhydrase [Deltaproteobacteria bacterium CG11_big_fil_rev_8_21_14_0_20_45_16]